MFNMYNNRHTKLCFPSYKTTIIPTRKNPNNNNKQLPTPSPQKKTPCLHLRCLHFAFAVCKTAYNLCVLVVVFGEVFETQQKDQHLIISTWWEYEILIWNFTRHKIIHVERKMLWNFRGGRLFRVYAICIIRHTTQTRSAHVIPYHYRS